MWDLPLQLQRGLYGEICHYSSNRDYTARSAITAATRTIQRDLPLQLQQGLLLYTPLYIQQQRVDPITALLLYTPLYSNVWTQLRPCYSTLHYIATCGPNCGPATLHPSAGPLQIDGRYLWMIHWCLGWPLITYNTWRNSSSTTVIFDDKCLNEHIDVSGLSVIIHCTIHKP